MREGEETRRLRSYKRRWREWFCLTGCRSFVALGRNGLIGDGLNHIKSLPLFGQSSKGIS